MGQECECWSGINRVARFPYFGPWPASSAADCQAVGEISVLVTSFLLNPFPHRSSRRTGRSYAIQTRVNYAKRCWATVSAAGDAVARLPRSSHSHQRPGIGSPTAG